MKITKSQLRQIIKEELGMMSEQEMDLEGRTFNFEIYHTERDSGFEPSSARLGLRAYLVNVPYSMLDPRSIERMKSRGSGAGRSTWLLKPSKEALEKWPEYDARVHRAYEMAGDRQPPKPPPIIDAQG